jgi:uncharacterized protein (TIGR02246 family)
MQEKFNAFMLVLALAAGTVLATAPARAHDSEAIANIIRALEKNWVATVASGDATAVANIYTADGLFMAPGGPSVEGREAIAKAWSGLMGLKNVKMHFAPTRIDVASRGDMVADSGAYQLSFDTDQGHVEDNGKYVVVWRNIDGVWLVALDIFNTNLPPQ